MTKSFGVKKEKILIIKTGASGDVVRTTVLLHFLKGDILWLTRKPNDLLIDGIEQIDNVFTTDSDLCELKNHKFDLIVNLDDDRHLAELTFSLNPREIVGAYMPKSGKISYSDSSKYWFDMSLISKFSKSKADELKFLNQKSYQEIIFDMFGKRFKGEEYIVPIKAGEFRNNQVAMETRSGCRWPTKRWDQYYSIEKILRTDGYYVDVLSEERSFYDFSKRLSKSRYLITGDTLSMHLGLAFRLKIIAIFTCTSPSEIYDYGRMIKVISPEIKKAFYMNEYIASAVTRITVDDVYSAFLTLSCACPSQVFI